MSEAKPAKNASRSAGSIAMSWHEYMTRTNDGDRTSGVNRATIAILRRVRRPLDTCSEPQALRLIRDLSAKAPNVPPDRIMMVPAILSHVTEDIPNKSLGSWLCTPRDTRKPVSDDNPPVVNEVLFRRFMAESESDLIEAFRRIIHRLGRKAPVAPLVEAVLYWGTERTERRVTYDYYELFPFKKQKD